MTLRRALLLALHPVVTGRSREKTLSTHLSLPAVLPAPPASCRRRFCVCRPRLCMAAVARFT